MENNGNGCAAVATEVLQCSLNSLTERFAEQFDKGVYHAGALYREVFKKGNLSWDQVPEFKASPRLNRQMQGQFTVRPGRITQVFEEGHLIKFITELDDNEKIESVIIPMANHKTLCVSSQVGCRMGCRFCQTAKMGFKRHLKTCEIVGQLFNARFTLKNDIKNIVFMGMGEPLDNFDNVMHAVRVFNEQKGFNVALRHITLSTAGLTDGIEKLAALKMKGLRLAVSVNSADDDIRSFLMPVNRRAPLTALKNVLSGFPLSKRGCFLFEYILIRGLNDSLKDAIRLASYIKPLPVRLNLIPYNPVDGFAYHSPDDEALNRFAQVLTRQGIFVIKRWSKGRSVSAGCGQLGQI